MHQKGMLAFDLGASNGRAVYGSLDNGVLVTKEIYRFENYPVYMHDRMYWDVMHLLHEIKRGMIACIQQGYRFDSLGVDTWGCTGCLTDVDGDLLIAPFHYRDACSNEVKEEIYQNITPLEMFMQTGFLSLTIHPLYHLKYLYQQKPWLMQNARTFLMLPDFINYLLTGVIQTEQTISVTSQMYDIAHRQWNKDYIRRLGFNDALFVEPIKAGTILSPLRNRIVNELGLNDTPHVVTVAGHDTASASAFIPFIDNAPFLYISSGTWSCLGCSIDEPIITEDIFSLGLTNDIDAYGSPLLRLNLNGLFILQECKKNWELKNKPLPWDSIIHMAESSPPFHFFVDTEASDFSVGGNMPEKIKTYCAKTGQPVPETIGEMTRAVIEGLAFRYRYGIEKLEQITQNKYPIIHMVGGGTKNRLLCQYTANVLNRRLISGPSEASVLGNLVLQAMGCGFISDPHERQRVIDASSQVQYYDPQETYLFNREYHKAVTKYNWT